MGQENMGAAKQPSKQTRTSPARTAEDMFALAIDRQDIKWCLTRLPADETVNRTTVDYELQILKIIAVGWALTYLLAENPLKAPLQEAYWKTVEQFAARLSNTSSLLIGQDIDYFTVLRQRLNVYLEAMAACRPADEPGQVIGAAFARLCGRPGDLAILMAGARLFTCGLTRVNEYLSATESYE
jgi:hypothetical protein